MSEREAHWNGVYEKRSDQAVSWFQPTPAPSLERIEAARAELGAPLRVIDVGGGASRLVDHLVERGDIVTVLDVASAGLAVAKARLGEVADSVTWTTHDITAPLPAATQFDVWHDRAVFHFMTTEVMRQAYLDNLNARLRVGGWLVLATFADDGPERCSGFTIQRYAPSDLATILGVNFDLIEAARVVHETPNGGAQRFIFTSFRKTS